MGTPTPPRNWSDDGHSREGAEGIEPTRSSKRKALAYAFAVVGKLSTGQIVEIGGSDGPRRVRELEQSFGWKFEKHRIPGRSEFMYWVVEKPENLAS
jgi:hypothetical protein